MLLAHAARGRSLPRRNDFTTPAKENKVKPTAHTAKPAITPKIGRFATLRGLLQAQGGGALALLLCLALAPISAQALTNPERHYEMVSPPYKGGYGAIEVNDVAVSGPSEGERVVFTSQGSFAGATNGPLFATYLARRSATGWVTAPLMLPSTPSTPHGNEPGGEAYSPSLESVLFPIVPSSYQREAATGTEEGPYTEESMLQSLGSLDAPPELDLGKSLAAVDGSKVSGLQPQVWSPDLCHAAIEQNGSHPPLLEEARGTLSNIYELSAGSSVAGCGAEAPALRLVAVGNEDGPHGEPKPIDPYCYAMLGEIQNQWNPVAADGQEIFFEASTNLTKPECDLSSVHGGTNYIPQDPAVLFARLNGQRTIEIDRPIAADCAESALCSSAKQQRAKFSGADEAGTRVFFTTIQPLVSGDEEFTCKETAGLVEGASEGLGAFESRAGCESGTGQQTADGKWERFGNDLYMATLGCPGGGETCAAAEREVTSLTQVSGSEIPGETAEVQEEARGSSPAALAVAANGERVYFVAHGVLTNGANREGNTPIKGAENLYVYDVAEKRNLFIADLCSGNGVSGQVVDQSCPGGSDIRSLLGEHGAQTTRDGEFLVFSSYGQLAPGDVDTAKDIYRYDAATQTLVRVSVGENGFDTNGNNDLYNVELPIECPKAVSSCLPVISEDGSRIVFATAEPLSPQAANGLSNVYEWHEGHVSLISSGVSPEAEGVQVNGTGGVVITPSGLNIFFVSAQGLVPQDTDGVGDVYDARLGEGFPPGPAPRRQCEGDACQGPLMNPAPLLVPGSVSQAPGENVPAPVKAAVKSKPRKTKKKVKSRKAKQGRKAGRHVRLADRRASMGRDRR